MTTDNQELENCPFCGSKPVITEYKTKDGTRFKYDGVHGQIECTNKDCELYSPNCFWFVEGEETKEKSDMIKAWNTRAIDPQAIRNAAIEECAETVAIVCRKRELYHNGYLAISNEIQEEIRNLKTKEN